MFKSTLKRFIHKFQTIKLQLTGSVSDYISTRPIPEQIFWFSDSPDGLLKTAIRHHQVYAYGRFFIVHIGGIWMLRIFAFIIAIWALLFVGFSAI